jgi:hypothetical protein
LSDRPQVLGHLGPYNNHAPVAAFGSLSDRAYSIYRQAAGGHERQGETPTQHLVTRMMYIAEVTSIALRLNASWALSHPALSLLRDRYEQTVRFSWLARQSDNTQMVQYIASYYAKSIKLYHSMTEAQKKELDKMGFTAPDWLSASPTKEQRDYLNRWNSFDLRSMANERDNLPSLSDSRLGKETLGDLYNGIYAQFSSVTHYDMYSMNILGFHEAPNGQLVLAPNPHFPSVINLYNSLFDLVQCFEATRRYLEVDAEEPFSAAYEEWCKHRNRVINPETQK